MRQQISADCKPLNVSQRFEALLENIKTTYDQAEYLRNQCAAVQSCLNKYYWNIDSDTLNGLLIGSAGKSTRVRSPRPVDLMFILPCAVYRRLQQCSANRQAELLDQLQTVLQSEFDRTVFVQDRHALLMMSSELNGIRLF